MQVEKNGATSKSDIVSSMNLFTVKPVQHVYGIDNRIKNGDAVKLKNDVTLTPTQKTALDRLEENHPTYGNMLAPPWWLTLEQVRILINRVCNIGALFDDFHAK